MTDASLLRICSRIIWPTTIPATLKRSYAKLTVPFYDELGNELTFMLSKKETQYVVKTITKKLDSMTVDDGGGGFDDEG